MPEPKKLAPHDVEELQLYSEHVNVIRVLALYQLFLFKEELNKYGGYCLLCLF